MNATAHSLLEAVRSRLGDQVESIHERVGEVTVVTGAERLLEVCRILRDDETLRFELLIDLCGVDYSAYGVDEWKTAAATDSGFSRGVQRRLFAAPDSDTGPGRRFAVVYHFLSVTHNHRLRLRAFAEDDEFPVVDSVTGIWASANWFEREAFDLYGIVFDGHPDMRRILTDYGFIGHPFRKDFPLSGNVEVRYDPEKKRVVYEPVSIEPRVLVPRVIRDDHRYTTGDEASRTDDA